MVGFSEAVRCITDEHNPKFAFKLVTNKAMRFINIEFIKHALQTELDKYLKTLN